MCMNRNRNRKEINTCSRIFFLRSNPMIHECSINSSSWRRMSSIDAEKKEDSAEDDNPARDLNNIMKYWGG